MKKDGRREWIFLLVATLAVRVWSGIEPNERGTGFLEVFPVLGAIAALLSLAGLHDRALARVASQ